MSGNKLKSNVNDISEIEIDLAEAIVSLLHLEISPASIGPEDPLFGAGLGLDSIDALEIAVCIWQSYGVEIRSNHPDIKRIFASLRNLAKHIALHRPKSAVASAS